MSVAIAYVEDWEDGSYDDDYPGDEEPAVELAGEDGGLVYLLHGGDHGDDQHLQPQDEYHKYFLLGELLGCQLAVVRVDAVGCDQPEEEEDCHQVDDENYAEEGAAAVGFQNCYGVERVVEHDLQDGEGKDELLLNDLLFRGDFQEPDCVQNKSTN